MDGDNWKSGLFRVVNCVLLHTDDECYGGWHCGAVVSGGGPLPTGIAPARDHKGQQSWSLHPEGCWRKRPKARFRRAKKPKQASNFVQITRSVPILFVLIYFTHFQTIPYFLVRLVGKVSKSELCMHWVHNMGQTYFMINSRDLHK